MAKKSSSKNSAQQQQALPKCTCQDPFKCDCGNRPPRPSKGHKWYPETQEWAGKGHKQKGASGQIADVAKQAITTDVGKTQVAQWQRLPTTLLDEACQKQGRAKPTYQKLEDTNKSPPFIRYRVFIRHSGKQQGSSSTSSTSTDRDLVFLPAFPVENDEQAKQEAALLALLQLTPTLPHERKLPEPYKTTWLHAIANLQKNDTKKTKEKTSQSAEVIKSSTVSSSSSSVTSGTANGTTTDHQNQSAATATAAAAKASTNLTMAHTYVSIADQKRRQQEQRELRNKKSYRQEAIRMANRDHPVFLSHKLRLELERMLRNNSNDNDEMIRQLLLQVDDDDDDTDGIQNGSDNDVMSDLQDYIQERLTQQGFTKAQARGAYAAVAQPKEVEISNYHDNNNSNGGAPLDLYYETIFDECLQWLLLHLEEDQLPERFDPRGRTLDVLVPIKQASTPATTSSPSTSATLSKRDSSDKTNTANGPLPNSEAHAFAGQYGIDPIEASLLLAKLASPAQPTSTTTALYVDSPPSAADLLWETLCQAASASLDDSVNQVDEYDEDVRQQVLDDEVEAMKAIFPDENECRMEHRGDNFLILQLTHSGQDEDEVFLIEFVISKSPRTSLHGQTLLPYPWMPPDRVLISRQVNASNNNTSGTTSLSSQWFQQGASLHIRLIQFMKSLSLGEPMLFEIYSHIQQLFQEAENGVLDHVSLRSFLAGSTADLGNGQKREPAQKEKDSVVSTSTTTNKSRAETKPSGTMNMSKATPLHNPPPRRRPRDRSSFWSTHPRKTPPAVAFPSIGRDLQTARSSLPAAKARSDFLQMLKAADEGGRVVLVTGDTGCGKTTQIPAFILEEFPVDAKIVVAQPRRLAATGVAARVANERGEDRPGTGSVGYVVRGDTAICNKTRLLFCTTGILLRQLQCNNALECVTHIVVDEVHERHLDTDVLLGILKGCLYSNPHLRIVLMSATLDADRFAAYWGPNTPRLHIPGRTFPVVDYTLEDVLALTGYIPPKKGKKKPGFNRNFRKSSSWADSEKSEDDDNPLSQDGDTKEDATKPEPPSQKIPIEDLIHRMDEAIIDYDLLGQLVKCLLQSNQAGEIGSILVFLPGAPEINIAMDVMRRITRNVAVQLLPLHGGLIPEEQNFVFRRAQRGFTKVILSSNVAETSITIPDCTIVIDSCREKQSSFDPVNRMPLLVERFAPKASLKQRRGRAGRVMEGTCYKLISKSTLEKLPEHGVPEIRRCALDQTLLSLLFLGIEHGTGNFLRTLLDPPATESIDAALLSLQKLGAVSEPIGIDGRRSLSPLGMHLAAIPAPPTVGKILVMGCILGCRSAAIAMAASMSVGRSPFLKIETSYRRPNRDNEPSMEEMKQSRVLEERAALFKAVGNSDHALIAAAYLQWDAATASPGERKQFCEGLGLNMNGMREMKQLVQQLSESLNSVGFVASKEADRNMKSWRVIRATAVAAMAPSQIVRVQRPGAKYAETAEGAMEKDGVAKELKFFIRSQGLLGGPADDASGAATAATTMSEKFKGYHGVAEERVFLHPSSANFAVGSFGCPWLVYHELVRTSKPFVRDSTECSTYALLLFGGKLVTQALEDLIVIDDWVHFSSNPRIGALIHGLRQKVDDLLSQKIENPAFDIAQTLEMRLIVKLLTSDGFL